MDRSRTPAAEPSTAVRTAGIAALDLLSRAAAGERGEFASAAQARRVVLEVAVFRQPENGGDVEGESQTHAAADAHSGHRSAVPKTQLEPARAGSSGVSVPVAQRRHRTAKSRLEHRYYVHSGAGRLKLGLGYSASIPKMRISRCMRLRFAPSITAIFRLPKNGHFKYSWSSLRSKRRFSALSGCGA